MKKYLNQFYLLKDKTFFIALGLVLLVATFGYSIQLPYSNSKQGSANFSTTPKTLTGDQIITKVVNWNGNFKVKGNIIVLPGGQLNITNGILELDGDYAAQYNFFNLGGEVNTSNATLGGTVKNNNIVQANFFFYSGKFNTKNTQIRYTWGQAFPVENELRDGFQNVFANNKISFNNFPTNTNNLRIYINNQLIPNTDPIAIHDSLSYGPNSDAIIMDNRAKVKLINSEFNINFKLPVSNGGNVDLWLPVSNPKFPSTYNGIYNGVFDKNNFLNLADVNFRLELINSKIPFWWVGLRNVNMKPNAVPTYIKLNDLPDAVVDITAENLRGNYNLPGTHLGQENVIPANTSRCFGNTCVQTFNKPAGVYAWGLYLWGTNTDVNVNGKSYIPEIILHSGKLRLISDSKIECNFPATSGKAAFGGKIYVENCNVGAPKSYNTVGDLNSDGVGSEIIICKSNINNLNMRTTNGGKIKIHQNRSTNSNVFWDKNDPNITWSNSSCPTI